jgi:hypothetical protein
MLCHALDALAGGLAGVGARRAASDATAGSVVAVNALGLEGEGLAKLHNPYG